MRRPRYKLQVSTFPFLAVLLCAMGSLLLFLFIMDRRAKIAAQHMTDEALQARKQRTKDEEDKLQADWEKAKEKLHQALLLQQGQLATQAQGLQIDLDGAGKKLQIVQTQHLQLDEQAKAEAGKIAEIQLQIIGRRAGLLKADKEATMSKKELLAAAQELAELEIAFQQLVTLKEREKQVHSLVPYHGKRGDSRTPIYIECVRAGVIFHPDDKLLQGFEFTPGAIRIEVERRAGPLVPATSSDDKLPAQDKKGVYVLFLVRPSGITNYYRAQAALKGYRLDFGYELIDQDWELDFGGTRYVKNGPASIPAKRTEMPIDTRPLIEPPPIYAGGPGPLPPPGGGPPSTGFGAGPIGIPAPAGLGGLPGFGAGGGSGTPGVGVPIGSGAGGGSGGPGKGPAFVPLNKILPPVPVASTDGPGGGPPGYPGGATGTDPPGATPYSGGAGPSPPGGAPYPGGGTSSNPLGGTPYPGGVPLPIKGGTGTGNPNESGTPSTGNPNASGGAPSKGTPNASGPNPSAGSPGQGNPGGAPNANGKPGEPGASGSGGTGDGGAEVGPPSSFGGLSKSAKKPASTPTMSKLLGNKDFLITIDCYNDHVNVSPGGMSFRWTTANMKTTDQAFAQAIANLIERRQASVRPGEPPYRPLICFRVTPDGRPSCLHVYPLLEPLRVPMTRENVVE